MEEWKDEMETKKLSDQHLMELVVKLQFLFGLRRADCNLHKQSANYFCAKSDNEKKCNKKLLGGAQMSLN